MKDRNKAYGIGIVAIFLLYYFTAGFTTGLNFGAQVPASIGGQQAAPVVASLAAGCPTDGDTTMTLRNLNAANSSAADWTLGTFHIFDESGAAVAGSPVAVVATSAGTSVTLDCGKTYTVKPVRSDAANGRGSLIVSTDYGTLADGNVKFSTTSGNQQMTVKTREHATLQFQLYDNQLNRVFTSTDTTTPATSTWNLTGVTYESTSNASATSGETLGTDDEIFRHIYVRAVETDTEFTDRKGLILVDADVSDYREPTVKYNGVTLTDVMDNLDGDEQKAFSAYEYAYFIPSSETLTYSYDDVYINVKAASGINPDVNIVALFSARGQYVSQDGTTIKNSAAQDDSAHTVVFTSQTVTQQIA